MAKRTARRGEHLFVETDGQVYLVRDRRTWRFPRIGERLPFPARETAQMDFGGDLVHRMKPEIDRHPEEWFQRDDLFARADVHDLVKRAVYMTMPRLVAEVVVRRGARVLMELASRGFSKGHWNLPGGFLEYGERPEAGAAREAEEELGVPVRIGAPIGTYLSGFPGKPTFTIGFVYRGTLASERFRLKGDEIARVEWLPVVEALAGTRNPFAKWSIVDAYRRGHLPEIPVRRHARPSRNQREGPVVFLDRDGTLNEDRDGGVRTPAQFRLRSGVTDGLRTLRSLGYRLAVVTNQDAIAWGWMTESALRRVHAKMLRSLAAAGVSLEGVYYCPHELDDGCRCRKPKAGMLLAACKDLDASPQHAWMVGDRLDDVHAGKAIGAATAFVGDARRRDAVAKELTTSPPDLVVPSVAAFARTLRSGALHP